VDKFKRFHDINCSHLANKQRECKPLPKPKCQTKVIRDLNLDFRPVYVWEMLINVLFCNGEESKVNAAICIAHRHKHVSNTLPFPVSRRWSLLASHQPGISKHCETTWTGGCITRYACLLQRFLPGTHSSLPQTAGPGLGAWLRAEVVYPYPSNDSHPPRH